MEQKDIIHLERKISIGMIASTEYLKRAKDIIELQFVQSKEAQMIMGWCLDYFKKYRKAPKREIQDIFMEKLRTTSIPEKKGALIEEILESLSDELEEENEFNVPYLLDQTVTYCKACKLNGYADQIQEEVQNGNILEAEQLVAEYQAPEHILSKAVVPLSTVNQHRKAFENASKPLLTYPGDIGDLLNINMTRESFVSFLGQNKGGKSFILMDAMFRGALQGKKVLFAQCGDMSQDQMERRNGIYLTKKSDLKKYCGQLYVPTLDCVHNLTGRCEQNCRERKKEGPLEVFEDKYIRNELTKEELIEAFEDYPNHKPCYNCRRYQDENSANFKGSIWYKVRPPVSPLNWKESYKTVQRKFLPLMNRIRLITYPSESFTMSKLNAETDILAREGFVPDIVLLDYMELLAPDNDTKMVSVRDQKNKKWQRGRRYSQERKVLFMTVDQSDTDGFTRKFLEKSNFSEDRRILDHVTAMFGLNMTNQEKLKGIMRINDIVGRETEGASFVHVFHRLQMGRPILGSFY